MVAKEVNLARARFEMPSVSSASATTLADGKLPSESRLEKKQGQILRANWATARNTGKPELCSLAVVRDVSGFACAVRSLLQPLLPFHSLRVSLSPPEKLCIGLESDDILTSFGQDYFATRHLWDPTPKFLELRNGAEEGSWQTHAQHLTAALGFRERFMRPEGWSNYAEIYFWHQGRFDGSICIRRTADHPDFSDTEHRLLKRLRGKLRHVVRRLRGVLEEQRERHCLQALVARTSTPMMVLDESFTPIVLNQPGHRQCLNWHHGPGADRRLKLERIAPVHPAIVAGCASLELREKRGATRRVVHPEHPSLMAVVESLDCGDKKDLAPAYAVWFSEPSLPMSDSTVRTLLSPCEWDVALQVSSGLTNREVAWLLGKSVSTVRLQMHAIFRKLGVRSRTELATRCHAAFLAQAAAKKTREKTRLIKA